MKKKVIYSVITAIAIATGVWNIYLNQESNKLSDLALRNIEALAHDEIDVVCYGIGEVYCPIDGGWHYNVVPQ